MVVQLPQKLKINYLRIFSYAKRKKEQKKDNRIKEVQTNDRRYTLENW